VAVQVALGPHCEFVEHWPQLPPEQISPAGHCEFVVHPPVVIMQPLPVHERQIWYDWQ
jgi:hypothetical protein